MSAPTAPPDRAVPPPDPDAVEAFAGRMVGVLNDGCLALMCSIGHQVGLFDALDGLPPVSSQQLADAAGLDERYVREWLGAMVTAGVVTYDPGGRTYALPPEHAASLTRAAGPDNLAAICQYVAMLAPVESELIERFRHGGGVGYEAFSRFHRVMAEDSAAVHDAVLVDGIVPLVPELADRLRAGIDVADVGCGSGHAVHLLAEAFPASRLVGYDISEQALEVARREATDRGLPNATFVRRDVSELGEVDRFDLVTAFDAIHDQAHPAEVLRAIATALRPGGVLLVADIRASSELADNLDHPLGPFLYTVSTMHCMTVSLAAGGAGLGTVWGEQRAQRMLADAGFDDVTVTYLDADLQNSYYIARRDADLR